jgi:hypothetical protein
MAKAGSPRSFKASDGTDLLARPFAGRAQPVGQYTVIAYRDAMPPGQRSTKIGEAARCEHHPGRFVMRYADGGRADIIASTTTDDGCVPLGVGADLLWQSAKEAVEQPWSP